VKFREAIGGLTCVVCIDEREDGRPYEYHHERWPGRVEARRAAADAEEEVATLLRDDTEGRNEQREAKTQDAVEYKLTSALLFGGDFEVLSVHDPCEVAHYAG